MQNEVSNHYNNNYFTWQAYFSEFGGWADKIKFIDYISIDDTVLDFGCGGGFLLKNLKCDRKVGVEVNSSAAACAKNKGVEVYSNTKAVPNDYVDVIISNHVLEHTLNPLQELKILYNKLKDGGKTIFVVPCESVFSSYKTNDINNHLFSWSPMCIGNLFAEAGFLVVESKPYFHKWPPKFEFIARMVGKKMFEKICRVYGRISVSYSQVRVVAIKRSYRNKSFQHKESC